MKNKLEKIFTCIVLLIVITTSFSLVSISKQGINKKAEESLYSISGLSTQDGFWPPDSSEWAEVAPETQGLNSSKIAEMFEYIENNLYDIHSVIIVRNGYLLTEEYLQFSQIFTNIDGSKSYPGNETLHMQQSTTKSLMSILIGIALQQGFLDNISQTLYEFFAHIWDPGFPFSELKKSITIEQLLTMNSGLVGDGQGGYPPGGKTATQVDCIDWALDVLPLSYTPGTEGTWVYSSDGPNLLSGIIANITGNSTEEFAKEFLFEPLGISEEEYYWHHDDKNMSFGGYGFDCTPKVQAKLGILSLNNGNWNGLQIADSDFMITATTSKTFGYIPYGYLWWLSDSPFEGYNAVGAGGQCIYVIPEFDIVVGFTANDEAPYEQMISDYILQFVEIPEIPGIPGFELNLMLLMVFCTSVVIIVRRKKHSKNS
ncbi:MAG: serine hydrolase domain-containing protein [Promethearchaeota archaeon]